MKLPSFIQSAAQRYSVLSRRERGMVAGAALALVLLGGDALFLSPAMRQAGQEQRTLEQLQADLASAQAQLDGIRAQGTDPNAGVKREIESLKKSLSQVDQELAQMQSALVAPEQMVALLENILVRSRGLKLISMQTLPASAVINRPSKGETKDSAVPAASADPGPGNIYRHGVELSIEGSYAELLAYVAEVERSPQRLLWGRVQLKADEYPKAVLTLTVYTLSLDRKWLVI